MSVQLLDKIRKINQLLHNNDGSKFVFSDICGILVETLESNVLVISKKGKVLGVGFCDDVRKIRNLIISEVGERIDPHLNDRFLSVLSTKENVSLDTLGFECKEAGTYWATINPIEIAGERLGTVFVYRDSNPYDIEDIILNEYGTTVVAMEMIRSLEEEYAEEARQKQVVKSAFSTLSYSEAEAIIHIYKELNGGKAGVLVASKIADSIGITRSIIVNALRKLESAGVIESRSSGMKGTYIKIVNDYLKDEIEELENMKNNS